MPIKLSRILKYAIEKDVVLYWREGIHPASFERAIEVLNKELGVEHLEKFVPIVTPYGYLRPVISLYSNYDVGKKPYANEKTALELAEKIRKALNSPRAPKPLWCFDGRVTWADLYASGAS